MIGSNNARFSAFFTKETNVNPIISIEEEE